MIIEHITPSNHFHSHYLIYSFRGWKRGILFCVPMNSESCEFSQGQKTKVVCSCLYDFKTHIGSILLFDSPGSCG